MTQKKSNITPNINSRLSVQVSLTGLSFLVTDPDTRETLFFSEKKFNTSRTPEEILLAIEEEIDQIEALQPIFETVNVVYSNNVYSTVPTPLFDESKASEYLKFNSKILNNDYIAYDQLDNHDITIVYVPYVNINNYFFERYGIFKYYHKTTIFLNNVLNNEKHSNAIKMYIHIQFDQFDCVVVKNGRTELCNTFSYKTPEDLIYYVLFCIEQLSLNPDTLPIIICGEIELGDSNYAILYRYIRHISFTEDNEASDLNDTLDVSHKNYILKSTP